MISKDEVKHIAKLARLELTEQEIEKMQKDLSEILDYFEVLKKAPAPEISKKNFGTAENSDSFRKDEAKKNQISDEIVGSFPDKKGDYIKVKAVL